MPRRPYARIADGSGRVRLDPFDPADTAGVDKDDVIMLKFYLHVSRDEQYQRLRAREKDPRTPGS